MSDRNSIPPVAGQVDIRRLEASERTRARDLADLVNHSYRLAQTEVFDTPSPRISITSMENIIAAGELVVAESAGTVVGVVLSRDLDERTGFFGMLAVPPEAASTGVARAILDHLEADARARGLTAMQLDLLMPDPPTRHQSRLREWYERRGYVAVAERPFAEVDPAAAANLRRPTALIRCSLALGDLPDSG